MRFSHFTLFVLFALPGIAQYHPPAGQPGSHAVHRDSSILKGWAKSCQVTRGPQDLADPSAGDAAAGEPASGTGKSDGTTVSLGDGGTATCTFDYPIINGPGPDFAVFENAITDDFLELAFVEVSSDGNQYFRFKSHSATDTVTQTGGFSSTDATKINNLAGKYRAAFGTPFDLEELNGQPGLDVNAVTHIRLVDVVGSVNNSFARRDGSGNKINDPWPTPFPSSGFDLDAVGVIHQSTTTAVAKRAERTGSLLAPNPVKRGETVIVSCANMLTSLVIYDLHGEVVAAGENGAIPTGRFDAGIYLVIAVDLSGNTITDRLVIY